MSEENQSTLDVSDLDNLMRAVKHAHAKGAYTMEEVAQLFPVVQRVESWLETYKSQLEASEVANKTMPMPEAKTEPEVTEEPKKKQAKTKKQKK